VPDRSGPSLYRPYDARAPARVAAVGREEPGSRSAPPRARFSGMASRPLTPTAPGCSSILKAAEVVSGRRKEIADILAPLDRASRSRSPLPSRSRRLRRSSRSRGWMSVRRGRGLGVETPRRAHRSGSQASRVVASSLRGTARTCCLGARSCRRWPPATHCRREPSKLAPDPPVLNPRGDRREAGFPTGHQTS